MSSGSNDSSAQRKGQTLLLEGAVLAINHNASQLWGVAMFGVLSHPGMANV